MKRPLRIVITRHKCANPAVRDDSAEGRPTHPFGLFGMRGHHDDRARPPSLARPKPRADFKRETPDGIQSRMTSAARSSVIVLPGCASEDNLSLAETPSGES